MRISELRRSNNMTQTQLAEILHVGRTTVCGYERGTISPPLEKIEQMCNIFGCTADYLLNKTDNRYRTRVDILRDFINLKNKMNDNDLVTYGGMKLSERDLEIVRDTISTLEKVLRLHLK